MFIGYICYGEQLFCCRLLSLPLPFSQCCRRYQRKIMATIHIYVAPVNICILIKCNKIIHARQKRSSKQQQLPHAHSECSTVLIVHCSLSRSFIFFFFTDVASFMLCVVCLFLQCEVNFSVDMNLCAKTRFLVFILKITHRLVHF